MASLLIIDLLNLLCRPKVRCILDWIILKHSLDTTRLSGSGPSTLTSPLSLMGGAHFLHPHTSILTLLGSSNFCTENDPLCFDGSPAVGCVDMVGGFGYTVGGGLTDVIAPRE